MASPGRSSPVTVPCQERREPVATDAAGAHIERLGLTRRELARRWGFRWGQLAGWRIRGTG